MLLHGIFPPITTPFYPDGNVYFKKLESNVERYSRAPVAGIVVLGSTGEAILLSDQERRDVFKAAREAAAPDKVLVAGTGIESAIETLRLTEYAAELGYDVAMVRTPHYYKKQMQTANILAFYRTVADRSPLPIIIYNFPQATGYDIPAEVVIELAGHPNLIGIKESSGDVEKVRKMVEGTRHIKRSATVTETFDAVTPRMLAAASTGGSAEGGELVPVGVLSGDRDPTFAAKNAAKMGHPPILWNSKSLDFKIPTLSQRTREGWGTLADKSSAPQLTAPGFRRAWEPGLSLLLRAPIPD
jgi:dihydrodipicolinate synthase/N-acetylneuraminate lyase